MIIKSFVAEQNIENLKKNIILFYGENLGLKLDLKKKYKTRLNTRIILIKIKTQF